MRAMASPAHAAPPALLALTALAALLVALPGSARAGDADGPALIVTRPLDGDADPIQAAIAAVIDRRLGDAHRARKPADGALESLARLREHPGAAIVRADLLRDAHAGAARFDKADKDLRTLAVLHDEVVHVVARPGIDALADLRGKRVALGSRESGDAETARALLAPLEVGLFDVVRFDLAPDAAATALAEGRIDAFFAIAPAPCPAVARALAGGAHLLPLTEALRATLSDNAAYPLGVAALDATAYPGLASPVAAEAIPTVLCASASLPRGVAEDAVEAIFADLDAIHAAHPAARAITVTRAAIPAPVPLHEGAIRFFERRGPLAGPIRVKTMLWVYGISDIDVQKGTFAFNGTLDLRWIDPRLSTGAAPYFEVMNDEAPCVQSVSYDVSGAWRTVYARINGRLRAHFALDRYPFDRQRLELHIEHPVFPAEKFLFVPEVEYTPSLDLRRDRLIAGFALDDWEIESVSTARRLTVYGDDAEYSRYVFTLEVRRALLPFFMKDVLPTALMVLLSIAAAFLTSEKVGDKLMLSVLALLVAVELQLAQAEHLPDVAYMTVGDWLHVLAYIAISMGILQSIVEYRLHVAGRDDAATCVRRGGLALAGAVFVVPLVILLLRRM